jgi:hypothetical protein
VSLINFEMDLPTVVLDMPELDEFLARRRAILRVLMGVAAILFGGLALLIYQELTVMPKQMVNGASLEVKDLESQPSVRLTVATVPPNLNGTVIAVDGEEISGDPPYVYLKASDRYHSIRISSPGYEVFSKDVQIAHDEMMKFSLVEREGLATARTGKRRPKKAAIDFDFASESQGEASPMQVKTAGVSGTAGVNVARRKSAAPPAAGTARTARGVQPANKGKRRAGKQAKNSSGHSRTGGKSAAAVAASAPAAVAETGAPVARQGAGAIPASLIINSPVGITQRVKVSVDGKMRGYLPVLLKVEPGLHELAFSSDGRRIFQMVKLAPGQISRIAPQF